MPTFTSNYPFFSPGSPTLLPTSERIGALPSYTGRGIVIAFIDAGFYPHPDIADRILIHANASTRHIVEQTGDFPVSDLSWHGQMTSVIACGDGRTSGGKYRGIASQAQLVLVKVSTPKGQIKEADILRGLRWVIDNHTRFNIRIVNISVGGDLVSHDPNHPLHKAVRKLTKVGITIVVAAGNRSVPFLVPPASASDAITVGGIDDLNSRDPSFWKLYHHNYDKSYDGGGKPELLAPAAWIASPIMPGSTVAREAHWLAPLLESPDEQNIKRLLKKGRADLGLTPNGKLHEKEKIYAILQQHIHAHKIVDQNHQHVDGTSVAAPIVTSVIAQMLEANPRLTPNQIRAILTATAQPLGNVPAEQQGAGVLNAAQAVKRAANQSA